MVIKIVDANPLETGDVSVKVVMSDCEQSEKKTFIVGPSEWKKMRRAVGQEIDEVDYDALVEADAYHGALKKGAELLSYGANSRNALMRKLIRRGFNARAAARAADYLSERGYINEEADAEALARSCISKGYGRRRIALKLRERGYDELVISSVFDKLEDVDFTKNCAFVIKKRCVRIPEDKQSRDRIVSTMIRYGYSFSEVRDAFRICASGEL